MTQAIRRARMRLSTVHRDSPPLRALLSPLAGAGRVVENLAPPRRKSQSSSLPVQSCVTHVTCDLALRKLVIDLALTDFDLLGFEAKKSMLTEHTRSPGTSNESRLIAQQVVCVLSLVCKSCCLVAKPTDAL